ncbi:hypothetical protein CVIRNUC_005839 [Coccomyxa viridis]|uniref:Uncharacterized protein n=1 Tax=Coccomyxa viridis TaxID=1274662 RepID=A0AAV1I9N1_9CHLO|nr:hypothetical protein CVIRNUC_005839 [Coccomyxa viridis]
MGACGSFHASILGKAAAEHPIAERSKALSQPPAVPVAPFAPAAHIAPYSASNPILLVAPIAPTPPTPAQVTCMSPKDMERMEG